MLTRGPVERKAARYDRAVRGLAVLAGAALLSAGCTSETNEGASPEPGSQRIAFVADTNGYVFTVEADGHGLRRLTRGEHWGAESVAWSPDGSQLAVVSLKVPDTERHAASVLVMDAEGTQRRRVALLRVDEAQPRWRTREGLQILAYEWPNRTVVSDVSPAGGGPTRTGEEPLGPLSPDGRWRALVRGAWPKEDSQIYLGRPDGSGAVNISRSRSVGPSRLLEARPSWSPDGTRIAFVMDRGRGEEIWVMRADGSDERRVARAPLTRAGPDWSPDGRSLAYGADVDDDGLDELYVADLSGGLPRKLLERDYIQALQWQPAARPKATKSMRPAMRAPRKPVRTFSYDLNAGSGRLADVRVLARFDSERGQPTLADISPDGSLVALFNQQGLALLDLRTNRLRVLVPSTDMTSEPVALFSPDGRSLLYRDRKALLVRNIRSGATIRLARSTFGAFTWLDDGRVVFADRGTLRVIRPGARASLMKGVPPFDAVAISPDGRRLLYDRRCETFLLDRRTGHSRRLSGHLFISGRAWAPDGSFFALQWAETCDRKNGAVWAYHSHVLLFSANGTRVARSSGRGATWSRDSTLLFAYPHQTGTATGGTQSLVAIDPRRRRESVLLPTGNAYSAALIGPGRWVVYTKYDRPDRVPHEETAGALYLARLVGG